MVNLPATAQNLQTDTWIKATWEEFLALENDPSWAEGKFYYDQGYLRIETSPLGFAHSRDSSIISTAIILFAALKNLRIVELTNASFRKAGAQECQPDTAFYIGADFSLPPRNNEPVNLDEFDPPTLVIETAASSLNDDLGRKRLLYERLAVQEYWVVNVNTEEVIAFSIANGRSGQVQESEVLPGLSISLIEEALKRSQTEDDGAITRWLLETFKGASI
ncbi:Uma2 family endonuclease [Leptolyngbya sp. FACHB-261]|uniref:Uma2 family endonuclease n=1 Tax=Leptolyngbya sp. FACHB-261 TaxID=2692806 RepID=UPI001689F323|nr:Uma2 family endonuclease [Leptolyngbya sp. FACHB-261]MBD2101997.1 Uma2 family endonuclease [Leptolyngbya sp. FACHB-261]